MEKLPAETLENILAFVLAAHESDKHKVLELRQVCSAFDSALQRPFFKTVNLTFHHLSKNKARTEPRLLKSLGHHTEILNVDLMVVRDDEEYKRVKEVLTAVNVNDNQADSIAGLADLKKYCIDDDESGKQSFTLKYFANKFEEVLANAPRVKTLKLGLPFPILCHASEAATSIFAVTMNTLVKTPQGRNLQTLVIDHMSDSVLLKIYNNPKDLENAGIVFLPLKTLCLSIRRQETDQSKGEKFTQALWHLVRKAKDLESLCLIGWNQERTGNQRHASSGGQYGDRLDSFASNSIPYTGLSADISKRGINHPHLKALELKRVNVNAGDLLLMIKHASPTLKKLFLNEVYLKIANSNHHVQSVPKDMWVGQPGQTKHTNSRWVAEELFAMSTLQLDVLRVHALGYDMIDDSTNSQNEFCPDIQDPAGLNRDLDERFVFVATHGMKQLSGDNVRLPRDQYDVGAYAGNGRNMVPSQAKFMVDGFFTHTKEAGLNELATIIDLVDKGMEHLNAEIARLNEEQNYRHMATVQGNPAAPTAST